MIDDYTLSGISSRIKLAVWKGLEDNAKSKTKDTITASEILAIADEVGGAVYREITNLNEKEAQLRKNKEPNSGETSKPSKDRD